MDAQCALPPPLVHQKSLFDAGFFHAVESVEACDEFA